MNAVYENPQRIPLLFGGKLWGFFELGHPLFVEALQKKDHMKR